MQLTKPAQQKKPSIPDPGPRPHYYVLGDKEKIAEWERQHKLWKEQFPTRFEFPEGATPRTASQ